MLDQGSRDHHRPVLVGHNHVVREYGDPAAADRLLPAHEGQAGDRGRRRDPAAPDGQACSADAGEIAQRPIGDQRGHLSLTHSSTEDVAKDPGVSHPHGVDDRHAAGRHHLDRRPRRARRGPRCGSGQVFARGHEPQRECRPDHPPLPRRQRPRPTHPDVAQAMLEQDGGDRGGRDPGERVDGLVDSHGVAPGGS